MWKVSKIRVPVLTLSAALCAGASAWEGNVCLNQAAVTDASGALVVLGTEGSWNDKGDVKEHVFDGQTSTFFDPPSSANDAGDSWAGIELVSSGVVTRVSYVGRADHGDRMQGCLLQGANEPDFSDAETFHTLAPPAGWNGQTWVDVTLDNVYGPYKYLRIIGRYCGNAGEVLFYGLTASGAAVPSEPQVTSAWHLNRRAGFQFKVDADVPQAYRVQRRAKAGDDYATFTILAPDKGGETVTWLGEAGSPGGDYRIRGVNENGKGAWTYFSITSRLEAAGTWIGTTGSWSNLGNTGDRAFDGDPSTYYDAVNAGGAWTGLDLGVPKVIAGVRYVPRAGYADRMVGGVFEGANQADFMDARTLCTVREDPPANAVTEVSFGDAAAYYRYVRYVSPSTGSCNVSEISFLLPEGHVDGPAAPTLSAPPGFSLTNVTVALDYPVDGAAIYYTLDGSEPVEGETANCFRYTQPLVFKNVCGNTNRLARIPTNPPEMWSHAQYGWADPATDQPDVNVLRARAFKLGRASTNEVVGTWLIGSVPNQHTLRVVSLQTDEANLFSDATGLMVPGDIYNTRGWNGHAVGLPNANYFQHGDAWERPVQFELFETNRQEVVAQQLGVRMHGNYSRSCAEKTLGFFARDDYGKKRVKYPLFGDEPAQAGFKRFLLRNSGNDWYKSGLRDAFGQSLFRGWVVCGTQGYEPAVVYINGAYWGIENFRHQYSKHHFEDWFGADPANLDYIKMAASRGYEVQEGDDKAYQELLDFLNAHDLAKDAAAWEQVKTMIDIDSFIDSSLVNMFLGNTDWPNNNQGFWRERVAYSPTAAAPHDGRWRFVVFDTDHGLGLASSATQNMIGQARNHPFFSRLNTNPEFIRRLTTRYADLLNTALAPDRTSALLSAAAARVRGEMPRHIARWTRQQSMSVWEGEISGIRAFLSARVDFERTQLASYYNAGATYQLSVMTNGLGRVQVNTLASGAGEGRLPLPFTGTYFANVPVTLTATPATGWRFVAWLVEGGEAVLTPTFELTMAQATQVTACFMPCPPPQLVVNEVMADAATPDWFELYNAGSETVELGGCWLTDDSEKHLTEIPAGVSIPAGGYLQVWADDTLIPGMDAETGALRVPFGLGKKGDEVNLWNADRSQLLAHLAFGAATTDVSLGSWPNGSTNAADVVAQAVPTPGAPNRSPSATGAWLPQGRSVQVHSGPVLLDCAVTNLTLTGSYALVNSPVAAARIDAAGMFQWTVPDTQRVGAYVFRVRWTSADGTATDETTLQVNVVPEPSIPQVPTLPLVGATRNGLAPLVYWAPAASAASYTVERATSRTGAFTPVATLNAGASHWLDSPSLQTNWYRIVATSPEGLRTVSSPQRAWASGFVHQLEGLVVGTPGSWENKGDTIHKLFDGNTSTYFDAAGDPSWGGLDLGCVARRTVTQIRYWPRDNWSQRMKNNTFDVARTSDGVSTFETSATLHTITSEPAQKAWTTVSLNKTDTWRYIRYNAESGNGNAAEIEFTGVDTVPARPGPFTVATNANHGLTAEVGWPAVANATGYLLWTNGVIRGFSPTNAAAFARSTQRSLTLGVSAVNGSAQSSTRTLTLPPAPPPPLVLFFR